MKSLTILSFSESVTTSDGYRRGYVSFAHFLLYLKMVEPSLKVRKKANVRNHNNPTSTTSDSGHHMGK